MRTLANQVVCRKLAQEISTLIGWRAQPGVVVTLTQNNDHPLLVFRLVVLAHEGVVVGIDGQHRKAMGYIAGRRLPYRPQTCDAHRLAIRPCDARWYRFA